jgi:hypothetical protein
VRCAGRDAVPARGCGLIASDFAFRGRSAANELSKFRGSWIGPRRRRDNADGTGTPGPARRRRAAKLMAWRSGGTLRACSDQGARRGLMMDLTVLALERRFVLIRAFRRVDALRTASVVRVWFSPVRGGFSRQPLSRLTGDHESARIDGGQRNATQRPRLARSRRA